MHESGDALVIVEAERSEHASVIGVPFRDPTRSIAKGVGGEHEAHGGGARREHLFPLGNLHMWGGTTHYPDHKWGARQTPAFGFNVLPLRLPASGAARRRDCITRNYS